MVLHFQPFEDTEFDRNFWRMFWVSLVLHVMVILGVAYSRRLVPPPIYYTPPSYTVDLVTVERPKPIRRPVHKAVPKKAVPPKAKPEKKIPIPTKTEKKATPPPKEVAKKTEKKSPPKPPAKEYNEKEIRSSITDLKKKVEARRAAEQQALEARGRITSRLSEIKNKVYLNTIGEIVKSNWTIPEGLHSGREHETKLWVTIEKSGRVINIETEESSGIPQLDGAAVRCIEKSSPFPPIPGDEEEMGIGFRFTSEGLK